MRDQALCGPQAKVIEDHPHNPAMRYIGTAECLPVVFLCDESADPGL